jgi:hypothetical protein
MAATVVESNTPFVVLLASSAVKQDKDDSLPAFSTRGSGSDVIVMAQCGTNAAVPDEGRKQ